MASTTAIINSRQFIVTGRLQCSFVPASTEFIEYISNLEIEFWQKSALDTFFLGKGNTDDSGDFVVAFEVNDAPKYLRGGSIENVFAKVYYKGILISGENPYPDNDLDLRPINDLVLREGVTNIGTFILKVSRFEYPVNTDVVAVLEKPANLSNTLLFDIREAISQIPLPARCHCSFRIYVGESPEFEIITLSLDTITEGYAALIVPFIPGAVRPAAGEFILNLQLDGVPVTPVYECFLQVTDGANTYYTPITDLIVYDGKLSVYSGGTYYPVSGLPEDLENVTIIAVRDNGNMSTYDSSTDTWAAYPGFTFYQMEYPENLDQIADGIYETNLTTGTITSGQPGSGSFEPFDLKVKNISVFPINIGLTVEDLSGETIFVGSFTNLTPGRKNFVMVETDPFSAPADGSPDIAAIETISGVVFPVPVVDFLNLKGLTTLDKLKKAGPLRYINEFPLGEIDESDLSLLQAHVDLYTIHTDAEQNQQLITEGFDNLYKIAETPKDVFLAAAEGTSLSLFDAARLHETTVQNQKLVTNLLSAKLGDYELRKGSIPDLPDSEFARKAFSKFINRCECEDCTSAVSPFSYLVDLVKYGAKHIKKTSIPSYTPVDYDAFLTLLENYFFQPFGSFNVDCDTLHKEYCRLRLVTEILEKYVATQTLPSEVALRLENDRKNFILLTYKTLLTQAGTSYEELRKVVSVQIDEERAKAALPLTTKLGIPLYTPFMLDYLTVDRMWLTFDSIEPPQVLNAANLETIFGFRDTQRDVLTNPSTPLMSEWKDIYLRDLWKSTDYFFSSYSREDVNPDNDFTFKRGWKPIIDPDIIGRGDMTYHSSEFALELWRHRKADTDEFLFYFALGSEIISRTSVDMLGRRLRVPGQNLSQVTFHNETVSLYNPAISNFVAFEVLNLEVRDLHTDVILKKSSAGPPPVTQPTMFQPAGIRPPMRYGNVLTVIDDVDSTSVHLSWPNPVILYFLDLAFDGEVQLISSGAPGDIYTTSDGSLDDLIIGTDLDSVSFTLNSVPSVAFQEGTISFIYLAEVNLETVAVPDPEKICERLFTADFSYPYLSPVPPGMTDPLDYRIWDEPFSWPGDTGSAPTYYGKLKKLYEVIRSGTADPAYSDVVLNHLHTDLYQFNLLMENLLAFEQYLSSMYSYDKPGVAQFYQTASILRNSGRVKLNSYWVQEEIKHIPSGGTDAAQLMLRASYFWKSLTEPVSGPWDYSLQTIPPEPMMINSSHVPIIDPELVDKGQILVSPDAVKYQKLYDARQQQLDDQREVYFSWLASLDAESFEHVLNHLNTGDEGTHYSVAPYADLNDLIVAFESTDAFIQLQANQVLSEAFGLTAADFRAILPVMRAYEDDDPSNQPTTAELRSVTDLFVTACKRKRFYLTIDLSPGWIQEEIVGSYPDGVPVKYFNVFQMRLDPLRGNVLNRSLWQQTLQQWNRMPTVFPDIVPPENIKRFVQGEVIHDMWINRKNLLDTSYAGASAMFNPSIAIVLLQANLRLLLSALVARTQVLPSYDYSDYIIALFTKEDAGEDIRPYLNQLNIKITEYRILRQVYEVLDEGYAPLLPSEYDDVINIAIRVNIANVGFYSYNKAEYENNIVLTGYDFQNYTPATINFPLNMVQETVQWRSPNADKKAWKDTLNTRIDRQKNVHEAWGAVVEATEDITLPVMRDALIQALRGNCESLENAAERIAKTLFIETKDNCCVKHSRVSHAIETIQGLVFALEGGIYDNYLDGFTFIAPNFKKEWVWLGSYATWRSAVFTYIYPENLLYPTLKRRQSPAFIELAETIQNSNRFTPLNACQAAKKYQGYFEDIQNLKIICTANTSAYIYRKDPLDCCGDLNNSLGEYMTFYIGQSTLSGKAYCSEKPYYADSDEHDFWKEIPLRENAKVIGCLPLNRDYDDNGQATGSALWLFYTFKEDGEFKLAYLKKDLMTPGSEWAEKEEIDLPEIADIGYSGATLNLLGGGGIVKLYDELMSISICQHSQEWDFVHFIFSYKRSNGFNRHVQIRYLAQDDFFDEEIGSILVFENNTMPVTSIRHQIASDNSNEPDEFIGITVCFEDEVQIGYYGSLTGSTATVPIVVGGTDVIGAFKKNNSNYEFVVANRDGSGDTIYREVYLTYNGTGGNTDLTIHQQSLTVTAFEKNILSIAPRFNSSNWDSGNAVTVYNNDTLCGVAFRNPTLTSMYGKFLFALAPEKRVMVPIESGDCIENFNIRTANIKENLRANLNAPQGNPIGTFHRTSTVKEVLYEAYYFVPMLIALDQQQRGEYPTALDWYRSVYDYTQDLTSKRKIFYGLVLEQSIANVFDRPGDWLLDPLNPHLIAQTRTSAYTKYTLMNIVQCMIAYGDREFTIDTIETVPNARKLYTEALGLLKVRELNVKPSQCYVASHSCFQTAVNAPIDDYWNNSFEELQDQLGGLNDVAQIEEASGELAIILNGTDPMEQKFSDAFTYLAGFGSMGLMASSTPTISSLMDGMGERMNDAYRYLFAELDTKSFNATVSSRFANTLATLNSSSPEHVLLPENEESIGWLKDSATDNSRPLEFTFINAEGKQLLGKHAAFDPLQPSIPGWQGNLVYANASTLYDSFLYREDYVPFVDYAFCLPSNPVYGGLELKANLELFKIHNCRNIAGMERSLDVFAAPTDSVSGVPIIGAGGNLILPGTGTLAPSQYRFRVLMERAKQLVSQAQQLEGQFLATLEKEDAENYSQLRARQDLQTAKSTVKLQDMSVRQAMNEETQADLQLDKMQFVQNTYNDWIGAGQNGFEIASLSLLTAATVAQGVATVAFYSAGFASLAQFKYGDAFGHTAQGTASIAQVLSMTSSIMSQIASYARREQEWQYQSDLAGYDISIANQQIKIAEQNTRIVSQEREIASINMDHATDTLEFLKTKFTNAELYRWMGNVLERTYSYTLSLATSVAKTAEQQYYFEQQEQAGPFILNDYWEVPQTGSLTQTGGGIDRRGLTGSTRLLQDITRLDQYAFETTKRKLQMTKVISLGQHFPEAFQRFRETGVLNFDLTNRQFDYDFPGHYLRLINGVKMSVIGLIPVYDNIKATLTAGNTSYTVIEANQYLPADPDQEDGCGAQLH